MIRSLRLAATLTCVLALAGCDLSSFGFGGTTRCDDFSCAWTVEQGALTRTGTWNDKDYAFSFIGVPTSVTRTIPVSTSPACLTFSYVGDIAASAGLSLQLDFADDGSTEVTTPLPAVHWKHQEIVVRAPADYRSLRVRLQKSGEGTVALAHFAYEASGACDSLPPVTLQNGASCTLDATCASGRCVLQTCSACGAGGCLEGESCRADGDCTNGACTANVCRACAKQGSCGAGERCSSATQCASGNCSFGSEPSLTSHPLLDGTCGECKQASDCANMGSAAQCVLGRCSECATDADCSLGKACRYLDPFEALDRSCVPKLTSQLPRGALCEADADCSGGLRCGGGTGRAKRCGFACGGSDCAADEVCVVPGARLANMPGSFALLASWRDPTARIATCFPTVAERKPCELAQQCMPFALTNSCCYGYCLAGGSDLSTGECSFSGI